MLPPDEPEDAGALTRLETPTTANAPIGPVARDALLRAIATRLGAEKLQAAGIDVPDEGALGGDLNLLSATVGAGALPDELAMAIAEIRASQGDAPITWVGDGEEVALVSAAHATRWLPEMARLHRGISDLAALATHGRTDVALMALARVLTQR